VECDEFAGVGFFPLMKLMDDAVVTFSSPITPVIDGLDVRFYFRANVSSRVFRQECFCLKHPNNFHRT
jgi:hypothetical protein